MTTASGVWGTSIPQHHAVDHVAQQPAAGMVAVPSAQGVLAGDSPALGDGDVIVQMLKRRMDSCMEQLRCVATAGGKAMGVLLPAGLLRGVGCTVGMCARYPFMSMRSNPYCSACGTTLLRSKHVLPCKHHNVQA